MAAEKLNPPISRVGNQKVTKFKEGDLRGTMLTR